MRYLAYTFDIREPYYGSRASHGLLYEDVNTVMLQMEKYGSCHDPSSWINIPDHTYKGSAMA